MNFSLIALILLLVSTSTMAQSTTDRQLIKKTVDALADAWTTGDGEAWSQHFAEDHDFVTWFGMYLPETTPKQNASSHQRIFDSIYKNTQQSLVIDKIRFLGEGIAIVHVLGAVNKKGEARPELPQVLLTLVMQKNYDRWKIVSLHNLDLEILSDERMAQASPIPLDQMFASWNTED